MKWSLAIVISLLALLTISPAVSADTSDQVTITATGYVCAIPGGFTVTYISDYEVELSWTKGVDAENTMVRAAIGRVPTSREDGYEVYYGTGTSATDWVNMEFLSEPIYYKAWHQRDDGVWEEEGSASGFVEGIGVLNACLIGLALGVSSLALWKRHMFLYLAGFIGCLSIGLYLVDVHPAFGPPLFIVGAYMLWRTITWWF